jgi:hypothetical protein
MHSYPTSGFACGAVDASQRLGGALLSLRGTRPVSRASIKAPWVRVPMVAPSMGAVGSIEVREMFEAGKVGALKARSSAFGMRRRGVHGPLRASHRFDCTNALLKLSPMEPIDGRHQSRRGVPRTRCWCTVRVQAVLATLPCCAERRSSSRGSAGVFGSRVLGGQLLRATRSPRECLARSVPSPSSGSTDTPGPLVFSLVPRC